MLIGYVDPNLFIALALFAVTMTVLCLVALEGLNMYEEQDRG